MKELTLENSDKVALVDDEDYPRLTNIKWYLNTSTGYVYGYFGFNKKRLIHRFLLGVSDRRIQVDHQNRNPLDCRRENLRICNNRQNSGNTPKRSTNKSGYKGVCWCPRFDRWRVTITFKGKQRHVGYFDDIEVAARAYDRAALEVFGEFALLNFPDEDNSNFDDGIKRRTDKWQPQLVAS